MYYLQTKSRNTSMLATAKKKHTHRGRGRAWENRVQKRCAEACVVLVVSSYVTYRAYPFVTCFSSPLIAPGISICNNKGETCRYVRRVRSGSVCE